MLVLQVGRELGLPLAGLHMGQHFGWTTDKAKADTMRGVWYSIEVMQDEEPVRVERAVRVDWTPSHDPRPDARKFDGWQISFPVGAEVCDAPRGD